MCISGAGFLLLYFLTPCFSQYYCHFVPLCSSYILQKSNFEQKSKECKLSGEGFTCFMFLYALPMLAQFPPKFLCVLWHAQGKQCILSVLAQFYP